MLNPDRGLVNSALEAVGLPGGTWLSEPDTALGTLIMLSMWGIGPSMVIFLAGLQGIPEELYEAGKIDGANDGRLFWHITLPQLTPTVFYLLITGMIAAFQYFVPAFVLTKGGPLYSTYFYNLNLYEKAFRWQFMGLASAMAWFLFVIVLALTLLLFRSSDAWVHYEVKR
jgi:multiple sugar transport system permease protein